MNENLWLIFHWLEELVVIDVVEVEVEELVVAEVVDLEVIPVFDILFCLTQNGMVKLKFLMSCVTSMTV